VRLTCFGEGLAAGRSEGIRMGLFSLSYNLPEQGATHFDGEAGFEEPLNKSLQALVLFHERAVPSLRSWIGQSPPQMDYTCKALTTFHTHHSRKMTFSTT
jgi:hypothetical protein